MFKEEWETGSLFGWESVLSKIYNKEIIEI
jgi:hypothetical protein